MTSKKRKADEEDIQPFEVSFRVIQLRGRMSKITLDIYAIGTAEAGDEEGFEGLVNGREQWTD